MRNDPEKDSLIAHLWADRRYAAMLGLGFSAGIPYLLVYVTQSAWLSEAKVPIETIGLMSELTIAYKFKFVWAPFLDRYDAPIFGALLGRRRGWIVVSQIAVMLSLAGVAFGDPAHWLSYTVAYRKRRDGEVALKIRSTLAREVGPRRYWSHLEVDE